MEKECIVLAHRWINNNIEYYGRVWDIDMYGPVIVIEPPARETAIYWMRVGLYVEQSQIHKVYESPRIGRWIETVSGLPMRVRARSPTLTDYETDSSEPWMDSPHPTSPRYIPEYDASSQETEESNPSTFYSPTSPSSMNIDSRCTSPQPQIEERLSLPLVYAATETNKIDYITID